MGNSSEGAVPYFAVNHTSLPVQIWSAKDFNYIANTLPNLLQFIKTHTSIKTFLQLDIKELVQFLLPHFPPEGQFYQLSQYGYSPLLKHWSKSIARERNNKVQELIVSASHLLCHLKAQGTIYG
uniref:Uncharacterized protein n=1 Tax=Sphaerodactylus townsendi TaxID=933632 RepID=A0ACB8G3H3_9SAUR